MVKIQPVLLPAYKHTCSPLPSPSTLSAFLLPLLNSCIRTCILSFLSPLSHASISSINQCHPLSHPPLTSKSFTFSPFGPCTITLAYPLFPFFSISSTQPPTHLFLSFQPLSYLLISHPSPLPLIPRSFPLKMNRFSKI